VTLRVAGADGNETLTLSSTGIAVDTSHTDSVTSSDALDYAVCITDNSGLSVGWIGMTADFGPHIGD
jgi:hypothetical protein